MPINVSTWTNQATLLAKPLACSTVCVFLVFFHAFPASHMHHTFGRRATCNISNLGRLLSSWKGCVWSWCDRISCQNYAPSALSENTEVNLWTHTMAKSTPFKSENREPDQGSRRHTLGVHAGPFRLCLSEACLITHMLPCMSACPVTETLPLLKPENNAWTLVPQF